MSIKEFNISLGTIKILEIKDNPDGTATIDFDIDEEFKNNLIKQMNWDSWSDEKFSKLVLEALENALKNKRVDRIED
jgi:hypothetical protein